MNEVKNKIKVVFWDLDDTLWKGTLAEGDTIVLYDDRVDIIKQLNMRGIVNSICSKNDYQQAKDKLIELGIWDLFVFPMIAFQAKGEMIKNALTEMNLREDNALFIDDNELNLREVEYYNPNASVLNSENCYKILSDPNLSGKDDSSLSRMKQYKLLEQKAEIKKTFSSNEKFLIESGIKIRFLDYEESLLDRLYELSERTNQLNFTKYRMTKDELSSLAKDEKVDLKLIHVTDNFGDYGIAGFYAKKERHIIHFVFSCRIMNMGIEQFIYAYLGYPDLEIVGDVAYRVSKEGGKPNWVSIVRQEDGFEEDSIDNILSETSKLSIFAIGACDLYHPIAYFDMPNQHFTYECNVFKGKERGVNVGTEYIRSIIEMTDSEKEYCKNHFYNYTGTLAFNSSIFKNKYDYVIMSFHDDEVFKIYKKKDNPNLRVILSPDKRFGHTSVINLSTNESSYEAQQKWLQEQFDECGYITAERFRDNILTISKQLDDRTKIVLISGPELDYFREKMPHCAEVREQIISLNKVLWNLEKEYPDKFAVADINKVIRSKEDVTDYVYHLKANTAYNLFVEIVWTIIRKLGLPVNKQMLSQIAEEREFVIFGNGPEARNAFFNLRLGGIIPKAYIHYDYLNKKIGDMQVEDCGKFLKDYSHRYYYIIADELNYSRIKELMENSGKKSLDDYAHLKAGNYKKIWNEEPEDKKDEHGEILFYVEHPSSMFKLLIFKMTYFKEVKADIIIRSSIYENPIIKKFREYDGENFYFNHMYKFPFGYSNMDGNDLEILENDIISKFDALFSEFGGLKQYREIFVSIEGGAGFETYCVSKGIKYSIFETVGDCSKIVQANSKNNLFRLFYNLLIKSDEPIKKCYSAFREKGKHPFCDSWDYFDYRKAYRNLSEDVKKKFEELYEIDDYLAIQGDVNLYCPNSAYIVKNVRNKDRSEAILAHELALDYFFSKEAIVLKPHPNLDMKLYRDSVAVDEISSDIPVDYLEFFPGLSINKVISIFSTAADVLKNSAREFVTIGESFFYFYEYLHLIDCILKLVKYLSQNEVTEIYCLNIDKKGLDVINQMEEVVDSNISLLCDKELDVKKCKYIICKQNNKEKLNDDLQLEKLSRQTIVFFASQEFSLITRYLNNSQEFFDCFIPIVIEKRKYRDDSISDTKSEVLFVFCKDKQIRERIMGFSCIQHLLYSGIDIYFRCTRGFEEEVIYNSIEREKRKLGNLYISKNDSVIDINEEKTYNERGHIYMLPQTIEFDSKEFNVISYNDIIISKKDKKFNFWRYKFEENLIYSIIIMCESEDVDSYSLVLYDFNKERVLFEKKAEIMREIKINFLVGENVQDVELLVYSGTRGNCNMKQVSIKHLEISYKQLDRVL